MDQYRSWNPRGTSNSEYGKFAYSNSFIGPARSGGGGGGQKFGRDASWGHQPDCHNHPQNQGRGHHQHLPDCPNASAGHDSTQQFDVFVGEEAATAALGGKDQYQAVFPTQQQSSGGGDEGKGFPPQRSPQEKYGKMGMNLDSVDQNVTTETFVETMPNQIEEYNVDSGGDASPQAQEPTSSAPMIQTETPKTAKIPPKWKGLPTNAIQYGRHIRPPNG
ncbi:uncharacterized protein LOC118437652 isoform X2 [Folsomia candida]|uniref:uncharacterized protein LOC118437652 isoform X2 n=1 Tax=Folsomia candida TaxID=158441 RepID=UPI00160521D3|nr:uncharacterized protein LOC118437652 isoform X2 [Folsomia candida]